MERKVFKNMFAFYFLYLLQINFSLHQNIAIDQNNEDNGELGDDSGIDDDDAVVDDTSTDPDIKASKNIRALVIYVFNENTGVMESAAQLVNTEGRSKNFHQNVANAKSILDSNFPYYMQYQKYSLMLNL